MRKQSQKDLESKKKGSTLVNKINPLISKMEMILQEFNEEIGMTHYPEKIYREKLRTFQKTSVEDSLDWLEKLEKFWPSFEQHEQFCFSIDDETQRKKSERKLGLLAQEIFN